MKRFKIKTSRRLLTVLLCVLAFLALTTSFTYSFLKQEGSMVTNSFEAGIAYRVKYDLNAPQNAVVTAAAPDDQVYVGLYTETTHSFTVDSTDFTVDGYSFLGWSTDKTAARPDIFTGNKLTLADDHPEQTLYGVWFRWKDITLTYHANEGAFANHNETKTIKSPDVTAMDFVVTLDKPLRETLEYKYTFLGWSADPAAALPDDAYLAGKTISLSDDLTLYAVWTPAYSYTINFDVNLSAAELELLNPYRVTVDPPAAINERDIVPRHSITVSASCKPSFVIGTQNYLDGLTFLGWAETPGAAEPDYPEGSGFTLALVQSGGLDMEKTLYAVWQWNYYVRFYKNDVSAEKWIGSDRVSGEAIINLTHDPNPSLNSLLRSNPEGARFVKEKAFISGYISKLDGGLNGAAVPMPLTHLGKSDPTDVYCVWTDGNFGIVYDTNGGAFAAADLPTGDEAVLASPESIIILYTDEGSKTLIDKLPAWTDAYGNVYRFLGWSRSAARSADPEFSASGTNVRGDTLASAVDLTTGEPVVYLYAVWDCAYQLNFDLEGTASWSEPSVLDVYGPVDRKDITVSTEKPTHNDSSNFEFIYWQHDDGSHVTSYSPGAVITLRPSAPTATFTAVWNERVTRSISYYTNAPSYSYNIWNMPSSYTITTQEESTSYTIPTNRPYIGNAYEPNSANTGWNNLSFLGWATSKENADAGIVSYQPGSKIMLDSTTSNSIRLYAVWPETVALVAGFCPDANEEMGGFNPGGSYYRYDTRKLTLANGEVVHYYTGYSEYIQLVAKSALENGGPSINLRMMSPYWLANNNWPRINGRAMKGLSRSSDRETTDVATFYSTSSGGFQELSINTWTYSVYAPCTLENFTYDPANNIYVFPTYAVYDDYNVIYFELRESESTRLYSYERCFFDNLEEAGQIWVSSSNISQNNIRFYFASSINTSRLKPDSEYVVDGWSVTPYSLDGGPADGSFPTNPVYSALSSNVTVYLDTAQKDLFRIAKDDPFTIVQSGTNAGAKKYSFTFYIHYKPITDPDRYAVIYEFGDGVWHLAKDRWSPRLKPHTDNADTYTFASATQNNTYDLAWCTQDGMTNEDKYYLAGFTTTDSAVAPSILRYYYSFPSADNWVSSTGYTPSVSKAAGEAMTTEIVDGAPLEAYFRRYYAVYAKQLIFSNNYSYTSNWPANKVLYTRHGLTYTEEGKEDHVWYVQIPTTEPVNTNGYHFLGYSDTRNSTTVDYHPGDIVEVRGRQKILYGVWSSAGTQWEFELRYYSGPNEEDYLSHTEASSSSERTYNMMIDEKLKPSRDRCTFLGWATQPDAYAPQYSAVPIPNYNTSTTITLRSSNYRGEPGVTKLYAFWFHWKDIDLNYDANGGVFANLMPVSTDTKTITEHTVRSLDFTITREIPVRAGYVFRGWANSPTATVPNASYAADSTLTLSDSRTLYAVWDQMDTYTLNLDLNLSAEQETYLADHIAVVSRIPANYTEYVEHDDAVNVRSHDVTLPADTVPHTLDALNHEFAGLRFLGWAESPDAVSPDYAPDGTVTLTLTGSPRVVEKTLYAVWYQPNYFVLHLDLNFTDAQRTLLAENGVSATGLSTIDFFSDDSAQSVSLTEETVPTLVKEGGAAFTELCFLGWANSTTAAAPDYPADGAVPLSVEPGTRLAEKRIYAVWDQRKDITLTYDANGGPSAPAAETKTATGGATGMQFTLETMSEAWENHLFLGWSEDKSATVPSYLAGNTITLSNNTRLYAVWFTVRQVTLTYDYNGAAGGPETDSGMLLSPGAGVAFTVKTTGPSRTNYDFLGWSRNKNAAAPDSFEDGKITISENTTLYAVWKRSETAPPYIYVLKYNANGGTGAPASLTETDAAASHSFEISTTKPSYEDHEFLGWALSAGAETPAYVADAVSGKYPDLTVNAAGDSTETTLYAVWRSTRSVGGAPAPGAGEGGEGNDGSGAPQPGAPSPGADEGGEGSNGSGAPQPGAPAPGADEGGENGGAAPAGSSAGQPQPGRENMAGSTDGQNGDNPGNGGGSTPPANGSETNGEGKE